MELLATGWFTVIRLGIVNYFDNVITGAIYTEMAALVGGLSLGAVTILLMIDGYAISMGKSSEPVGGLVLKWLKIILLITLATWVGTKNNTMQDAIVSVRDGIGSLVAGGLISNATKLDMYDMINAKMVIVAAVSTFTSIITSGGGGDHEFSTLATVIFASIGTTAPIMTALVTSLTMEMSIKIATMLGPICIFAGIFKRTEDWPIVWAKYMFGVMLTSAFMALTVNIAIGVTAASSLALVGSFYTGTSLIVLSTFSLLSGLVMSMLMITLPAVAVKVIGGVAEGAAQNALGGGWDQKQQSDRVGGYQDRSLGIAQRQRYREPSKPGKPGNPQ